MSKPFQFSMRRMFAAVTLLCVAALLFTLAQRARTENYEDAVELIASPVFAGAGIGLLFRRPMIGDLPALCSWGFRCSFSSILYGAFVLKSRHRKSA
jgi:hypothetical protein